jgi:phage-related protein
MLNWKRCRWTCGRASAAFRFSLPVTAWSGVREPYVKHLEGRLWEMRMSGRDGIARAIYVTARGSRVVVVRVFVKKTEKTPRSEIELALRRVEEVR